MAIDQMSEACDQVRSHSSPSIREDQAVACLDREAIHKTVFRRSEP